MIVDAHLHVWRAIPEYPDPAVTAVSPASDVPLELLSQYMDEHDVDRAVLVQPVYYGDDNCYVADCAAHEPSRFAAVCVVDPREEHAAEKLTVWVEGRGCRGLRLRPRIYEESACFADPSTDPLWRACERLGIVVSVLSNEEHLPKLIQVASRFPQVPVIVDHLSMIDVRQGCDSERCQQLLKLAKMPNVYLKLSGFPYYSDRNYPFEDCVPLVRRLYEQVGAQRLLWGSDFPHVLLQYGYARSRYLIERAFPFIAPADRARIMGKNAASLYWPDER